MAKEHPDELLADFQQYYGMDVWDWTRGRADDLEAPRIAALAYQLPTDSRTRTAADPVGAYGMDVLLLRRIEHNQRLWAWAHSKDAKTGTNEPEQIGLPGEDEHFERRAERELRQSASVAATLGIEI